MESWRLWRRKVLRQLSMLLKVVKTTCTSVSLLKSLCSITFMWSVANCTRMLVIYANACQQLIHMTPATSWMTSFALLQTLSLQHKFHKVLVLPLVPRPSLVHPLVLYLIHQLLTTKAAVCCVRRQLREINGKTLLSSNNVAHNKHCQTWFTTAMSMNICGTGLAELICLQCRQGITKSVMRYFRSKWRHHILCQFLQSEWVCSFLTAHQHKKAI